MCSTSYAALDGTSFAFNQILASSELDPGSQDAYDIPIALNDHTGVEVFRPASAQVNQWHGGLYTPPVSSWMPASSSASSFQLCLPDVLAQTFPTAPLTRWQYPQNFEVGGFLDQWQIVPEKMRECGISSQFTRPSAVSQPDLWRNFNSESFFSPGLESQSLPTVTMAEPPSTFVLPHEVSDGGGLQYPEQHMWADADVGHAFSAAARPLEYPLPAQKVVAVDAQPTQGKPSPRKESLIQCPVCAQHFHRPSHLKEHMRGHEGQHVCPTCGKKFLEKNQLGNHKKSHDGPFPCTLCPKVFPKRAALTSHVRTHDPLRRTVKCPVEGCGKQYRRGGCLNRHMKSVCAVLVYGAIWPGCES